MTTYEIEDLLNEASKFDDRLDLDWAECVGDREYQTLCELFDENNFSHDDDYDGWIEVNTAKEWRRILKGKDVHAIIRYAVLLGRLIGRAEQILLTRDD